MAFLETTPRPQEKPARKVNNLFSSRILVLALISEKAFVS